MPISINLAKPRGTGILATYALLLWMGFATPIDAAEGDPVAIRRWPSGDYSVENHWGLQVIVRSEQALDASANDHSDADSAAPLESRKQVGFTCGIDHVLSRMANRHEVTWLPRAEQSVDPNSIHVRSMVGNSGECDGLHVMVDGVSIHFLTERFSPAVDGSQPVPDSAVDVIVMLGSLSSVSDACRDWVHDRHPNHVLLGSEIDQSTAADFARQIHANESIGDLGHNTFAVSKKPIRHEPTQFIKWHADSRVLSQELESLFVKMEASCRRSQQVFETLSAHQLNFRPANGTHTARWNAEHMMGRQLLFFSQIYHAIDPTIPVMDLNPQQMPPDYIAAHPEWDGKEESRQMQRVGDFTRRFAYLLDGVDLDVRAPGSRWTVRGLLSQMERHYDDHTGNTKQKFQLADWPAE